MVKKEKSLQTYMFNSYIYGTYLEDFNVETEEFLNFIEDMILKNETENFITPKIRNNILYLLDVILYETDNKDINIISDINKLAFELRKIKDNDCVEFYKKEHYKRTGYKVNLKKVEIKDLQERVDYSISLDYTYIHMLMNIPLYEIFRSLYEEITSESFIWSLNEFHMNFKQIFADSEIVSNIKAILLHNKETLSDTAVDMNEYYKMKILNNVIIKKMKKIK
ncbi:MAG TPA: hypothetical protein GX747_04045 [Tenericutes bacterium]|nr:hypothetical protein [Mycoplasmatota bacterium]